MIGFFAGRGDTIVAMVLAFIIGAWAAAWVCNRYHGFRNKRQRARMDALYEAARPFARAVDEGTPVSCGDIIKQSDWDRIANVVHGT